MPHSARDRRLETRPTDSALDVLSGQGRWRDVSWNALKAVTIREPRAVRTSKSKTSKPNLMSEVFDDALMGTYADLRRLDMLILGLGLRGRGEECSGRWIGW